MPRKAYNISRQRTECFTINGLLTYYAMRKRDVRKGDIDQAAYPADRDAIGRILQGLGYTRDREANTRDFRRVSVFAAMNYAFSFWLILDALRRSRQPMTARQIARAIVLAGHNRDLVETDLAARISKACLRMPKGAARRGTDGKSNVVWSV